MSSKVGGLSISKKYIDVKDSKHLEFIRCNLKRGVSPQRLCEYVRDEFGECIPQKKMYSFRRDVFPDVEAIVNQDIIDPCDDENNDNISTRQEVINIGLRILKKDLLAYERGEKQIATASVGQIVGMLSKMEDVSDNAVPIEDVIDNQKAVDIVIKGSKYDKQ